MKNKIKKAIKKMVDSVAYDLIRDASYYETIDWVNLNLCNVSEIFAIKKYSGSALRHVEKDEQVLALIDLLKAKKISKKIHRMIKRG